MSQGGNDGGEKSMLPGEGDLFLFSL